MAIVDIFTLTTKAFCRMFKQALITLLVASNGVTADGQTPFKTFEFRHCPTDLICDAMYVGIHVTITHCVEMCALRPWCAALTYRRQYPLCELFSKTGLTLLSKTEVAGYCQYVDEDNFSVTVGCN
ncbi:hypothetical protein DPMN_067250 [Dreissena polymorpha]|uniref:Apple domain-containing protein n=1 Tax=Dreissena polymorpha TaxID=45954 RepID=A0A9D3Z0F1_DREPO|nr:hypothetical protein DPMN_067250 [Dreissena polymorpha]